MKRLRFSELFWTAAVIIFIAMDRDIYSSMILTLASAYLAVDVLARIRRRRNDAQR